MSGAKPYSHYAASWLGYEQLELYLNKKRERANSSTCGIKIYKFR
jgi:hypothetical protein